MKNKINKPFFPPVSVITLGILMMSTASIIIRFAQVEAQSLVIAAYRITLAVLILSPIMVFRYHQELTRLDNKDFRLAILSGLFLALHFATWISSLEYTTVASSVVLVSTTPLWVALLSPLFIKESVTRYTMLGLLVASLGTILIGVSDACSTSVGFHCPPLTQFVQGKAFWGDILAVFGAFFGAGYILVGRGIRSKVPLMVYIFVVYGVAAVVLCTFVFGTNQQIIGYSPKIYLWMFLLAVGPQLFGHSTVNWALGFLPAAFVSITLLGEPIGSILLAYVFLNESPGFSKLFGAILILGGIIIASQKNSETLPRMDQS